VLSDDSSRSRLLLAEFRVFMNVAPPCNQLGLDLSSSLADFLFKVRDD